MILSFIHIIKCNMLFSSHGSCNSDRMTTCTLLPVANWLSTYSPPLSSVSAFNEGVTPGAQEVEARGFIRENSDLQALRVTWERVTRTVISGTRGPLWPPGVNREVQQSHAIFKWVCFFVYPTCVTCRSDRQGQSEMTSNLQAQEKCETGGVRTTYLEWPLTLGTPLRHKDGAPGKTPGPWQEIGLPDSSTHHVNRSAGITNCLSVAF